MVKPIIQITPYADINTVLQTLLANARGILKEQFTGMYLYGSLALGDFNLNRSDIDFLIVTEKALSEKLVSELEAMHSRLAAGGSIWVGKLEGGYMPKTAVRQYVPGNQLYPEVDEGKFQLARCESDWVIKLYTLREHGIVLAGPSTKELVDPITLKALQQISLETLLTHWAPIIDNPESMFSGPGYPAYAVHTMCRILYTLKHGTITSKPIASNWALKELGKEWSTLIQEANKWEDGKLSINIDETLRFISYTIDMARQEK